MRILFITYFFPPAFGAGVVRITKTIKYLVRLGHEVTVLTCSSPRFWNYEMDLVRDIPAEARVVRVDGLEIGEFARNLGKLFKFLPFMSSAGGATGGAQRSEPPALLKRIITNVFFLPDEKVGWLVPALTRGLLLCATRPYDVILSTSPAITNHLVALYLKKFMNIPWVADFRDPWASVDANFWPLRRKLNLFIERLILSQADWITTISRTLARSFDREYPVSSKISVITNGYDPEDFQRISVRRSEKFRIVYTGTFYGESRSPEPFLDALGGLVSSGKLPRDRISFEIFGPENPPYLEKAIKSRGLEDIVSHNGFTSYFESLKIQKNAGLLLLITQRGEGTKGQLTAKFFEYIGSGRPVLAITEPEGELAELVLKGRFGYVADHWDISAMKKGIMSAYHIFTRGMEFLPREDVKVQFSRQFQTKKLAHLLERVRKVAGKEKRL